MQEKTITKIIVQAKIKTELKLFITERTKLKPKFFSELKYHSHTNTHKCIHARTSNTCARARAHTHTNAHEYL